MDRGWVSVKLFGKEFFDRCRSNSIHFLVYMYINMYWTFIIIIIVMVVVLVWFVYRQINEDFVNPSVYYQQHSRYPTNAWWITDNQPCHLQARQHCHNQYCYDNCYENVLKSCSKTNPPRESLVSPRFNPDLLPYQVITQSPPSC